MLTDESDADADADADADGCLRCWPRLQRVRVRGVGAVKTKPAVPCNLASGVQNQLPPPSPPMEAKQPPSSRFAGALLPQASATKPGAKKLVIKQYTEKPKLPESFDVDTWGRLSSAVAALLQQQPASHSFEEL